MDQLFSHIYAHVLKGGGTIIELYDLILNLHQLDTVYTNFTSDICYKEGISNKPSIVRLLTMDYDVLKNSSQVIFDNI